DIPDNPRPVTSHITRISVVEHFASVSTELFGCKHHGNQRPRPASLGPLIFHFSGEPLRIETVQPLQTDPVQQHGFFVGIVMRQIAARDNKYPLVTAGWRTCIGQLEAKIVVLGPHYDGRQREGVQHDLDERELDFKGMLPGVGLRDVVYDGGVLIELINQLAVQRDNAQGGAISAQIVDARSGETCMVAGSEYEHPVKTTLQKELIRPGSYASRIDIPRVRNDKTGKLSLRIGRAGPVKIPDKLLFEQRRIGRVPGPCNYRLT